MKGLEMFLQTFESGKVLTPAEVFAYYNFDNNVNDQVNSNDLVIDAGSTYVSGLINNGLERKASRANWSFENVIGGNDQPFTFIIWHEKQSNITSTEKMFGAFIENTANPIFQVFFLNGVITSSIYTDGSPASTNRLRISSSFNYNTSVSVGGYNMYAWTYSGNGVTDPASLKFYYNGVLDATSFMQGTYGGQLDYNSTACDFFVGGIGQDMSSGSFDECYWIKKEMSASEMLAAYNAGLNGETLV